MKQWCIGALMLTFSVPVTATETITYTYDAQGRVIKIVHSGTVNNDVQTVYVHDSADNRTRVTTTP